MTLELLQGQIEVEIGSFIINSLDFGLKALDCEPVKGEGGSFDLPIDLGEKLDTDVT